MLAAIPPKGDRALESFRMFLALRSKEDAYSLALFDYFSYTLRERLINSSGCAELTV